MRRAREREVERATAGENVIDRNTRSGAVVAPLAESASIDSSVTKPEENPSPCRLEDAAPLELKIVTEGGSRTDRQLAVDAYLVEVNQKSEKRITRTDLWKSERYKTRTEFERWETYWYEKHGRSPNKTADQKFTRMLKQKPHPK